MKLIIALALCVAVTSGAWWDWGKNWKDWLNKHTQHNYVLDYVHSYRFEEHTKQGMKLLIAISDRKNDKSCHIIEISDEFEEHLTTHEGIEMVTEDIFNIIKEHRANETAQTIDDVYDEYKDNRLDQECYGHDVYVMEYQPKNATSGMDM